MWKSDWRSSDDITQDCLLVSLLIPLLHQLDKNKESKQYRTEKARSGGRKQGYLDSLDTRIKKTLISLGDVLNCRKDYFSELFERNVVIETGSFSGNMQKLLVSWLAMKVFLYSIRNPSKEISHVIIFDEAQSQIWSKDLERRGRTPFMANLATQARSFGVGLIVLAQNRDVRPSVYILIFPLAEVFDC